MANGGKTHSKKQSIGGHYWSSMFLWKIPKKIRTEFQEFLYRFLLAVFLLKVGGDIKLVSLEIHIKALIYYTITTQFRH